MGRFGREAEEGLQRLRTEAWHQGSQAASIRDVPYMRAMASVKLFTTSGLRCSYTPGILRAMALSVLHTSDISRANDVLIAGKYNSE